MYYEKNKKVNDIIDIPFVINVNGFMYLDDCLVLNDQFYT